MLTICCRCSAANVNMPCPQMLHFLGASNQHSVTLSRAVRAPRCTQGKRKLMKGPAPSRHYAAESDGDANPSGLDSSISESSHSYPGLSKKNVEKQAVFPPPHGFPISYHTKIPSSARLGSCLGETRRFFVLPKQGDAWWWMRPIRLHSRRSRSLEIGAFRSGTA